MTFWKTTFIWFGIREALRAPKYYQCKDFVQFQESHWIQLERHLSAQFALGVEGSAWWDSDVEEPAGLGAMGPPPRPISYPARLGCFQRRHPSRPQRAGDVMGPACWLRMGWVAGGGEYGVWIAGLLWSWVGEAPPAARDLWDPTYPSQLGE